MCIFFMYLHLLCNNYVYYSYYAIRQILLKEQHFLIHSYFWHCIWYRWIINTGYFANYHVLEILVFSFRWLINFTLLFLLIYKYFYYKEYFKYLFFHYSKTRHSTYETRDSFLKIVFIFNESCTMFHFYNLSESHSFNGVAVKRILSIS